MGLYKKISVLMMVFFTASIFSSEGKISSADLMKIYREIQTKVFSLRTSIQSFDLRKVEDIRTTISKLEQDLNNVSIEANEKIKPYNQDLYQSIQVIINNARQLLTSKSSKIEVYQEIKDKILIIKDQIEKLELKNIDDMNSLIRPIEQNLNDLSKEANENLKPYNKELYELAQKMIEDASQLLISKSAQEIESKMTSLKQVIVTLPASPKNKQKVAELYQDYSRLSLDAAEIIKSKDEKAYESIRLVADDVQKNLMEKATQISPEPTEEAEEEITSEEKIQPQPISEEQKAYQEQQEEMREAFSAQAKQELQEQPFYKYQSIKNDLKNLKSFFEQQDLKNIRSLYESRGMLDYLDHYIINVIKPEDQTTYRSMQRTSNSIRDALYLKIFNAQMSLLHTLMKKVKEAQQKFEKLTINSWNLLFDEDIDFQLMRREAITPVMRKAIPPAPKKQEPVASAEKVTPTQQKTITTQVPKGVPKKEEEGDWWSQIKKTAAEFFEEPAKPAPAPVTPAPSIAQKAKRPQPERKAKEPKGPKEERLNNQIRTEAASLIKTGDKKLKNIEGIIKMFWEINATLRELKTVAIFNKPINISDLAIKTLEPKIIISKPEPIAVSKPVVAPEPIVVPPAELIPIPAKELSWWEKAQQQVTEITEIAQKQAIETAEAARVKAAAALAAAKTFIQEQQGIQAPQVPQVIEQPKSIEAQRMEEKKPETEEQKITKPTEESPIYYDTKEKLTVRRDGKLVTEQQDKTVFDFLHTIETDVTVEFMQDLFAYKNTIAAKLTTFQNMPLIKDDPNGIITHGIIDTIRELFLLPLIDITDQTYDLLNNMWPGKGTEDRKNPYRTLLNDFKDMAYKWLMSLEGKKRPIIGKRSILYPDEKGIIKPYLAYLLYKIKPNSLKSKKERKEEVAAYQYWHLARFIKGFEIWQFDWYKIPIAGFAETPFKIPFFARRRSDEEIVKELKEEKTPSFIEWTPSIKESSRSAKTLEEILADPLGTKTGLDINYDTMAATISLDLNEELRFIKRDIGNNCGDVLIKKIETMNELITHAYEFAPDKVTEISQDSLKGYLINILNAFFDVQKNIDIYFNLNLKQLLDSKKLSELANAINTLAKTANKAYKEFKELIPRYDGASNPDEKDIYRRYMIMWNTVIPYLEDCMRLLKQLAAKRFTLPLYFK